MRPTWRYLKELYRRGFALFVLAPLIIAVAAIPEFVQHIAEIKLGMFVDIEHARALANDSTRWSFGYFKLAGMGIGMLAAARYWGTQAEGRRWWDLRSVAWSPFLLGLALFIFVPAPLAWGEPYLPAPLYWTLYAAVSLGTLPLLFTIMGGLFGDRRAGPLANYWLDWRWLPLLVVLLVAAYAPPMALHYGLHRLAMGRPEGIVWPLMAADALVVGLLASLVGAAFALSYRAARGGMTNDAHGAQA